MFSSLPNFSSIIIHWSLVCHVWPGREADVIPIRPLFPWTCISIHHFCHMLSTHSQLDQTQGPQPLWILKRWADYFMKLLKLQQTWHQEKMMNNHNHYSLFIIPKPGINELIPQLPRGWTELFISFTNITLLGKIEVTILDFHPYLDRKW